MTLPRVFILVTLVLSTLIGYGVWSKRGKESGSNKKETALVHSTSSFAEAPIEIDLKNLQPIAQAAGYTQEKVKIYQIHLLKHSRLYQSLLRKPFLLRIFLRLISLLSCSNQGLLCLL